jgi:hypothetical protein
MERKANEMMGVTFNGQVTFQGPMFDIHDNKDVHIEKLDKMEDSPACDIPTAEKRQEELCLFIHPSVPEQQEWQVHDEIKRLVKRQGLQEICKYLLQMKEERLVLLPQLAEKAYNELARMGMPTGDGYSLKTFTKYYQR